MSYGPLFLPDGSVQAIIALIVIIFFCVYILKGIAVPELFGMVVINIVGLYFMSRKNDAQAKQADQIADLSGKVAAMSLKSSELHAENISLKSLASTKPVVVPYEAPKPDEDPKPPTT